MTISHDRYFLDRVATQILALDGVGGAEHYDGDYTEYHDWKLGIRDSAAPLVAEPDNLVTVAAPAAPVVEPLVVKAPPQPKKPGVKVVKKKKPERRTPEQIENDIAEAEARLNDISQTDGHAGSCARR